MPAYTPARLTFTIKNPGTSYGIKPSFIDINVSASTSAVFGTGWFDAWCADRESLIYQGTTYNGGLYSSYELDIIRANIRMVGGNGTGWGGENIGNLDAVNWLLHQYYTNQLNPTLYRWQEVQWAIWKLLGDNPSQSNNLGGVVPANGDALYNSALTSGNNYKPDPGLTIAALVDTRNGSNAQHQPLLLITQAAALGDYVWEDFNLNGCQDDGHNAGINGVQVILWRDLNGDGLYSGGLELLDQTTTGNNPNASDPWFGKPGYYEFKGLLPGQPYQVKFVAPAGYHFTLQDDPDCTDAADSDASPDGATKGQTSSVTLTPGQWNRTIDGGLWKPSKLGDFVFVDKNRDGNYDPGTDHPKPGIEVHLFDCITHELLATDITDENGLYLFDDLKPGSYKVQFVLPDSGYAFTTQSASAPDAVNNDSDADPATGFTTCVDLGYNETELDVDAGLVEVNMTIDVEKLVKGRYTEESGGGEGLTPGFWKNHSEYGPAPLSGWPETGYDPDESYESIFGVQVDGTPSLLDALGARGGGVNALLRHSTAALLNAANPYVDYFYSLTDIIAKTQQAILSGNATLIEQTKNEFAQQNELGADLGTPSSGTVIETPYFDADLPGTGPNIPVGGQAIFKYLVTNTSGTQVTNVVLVDDNGTPGDPTDDFNPTYVSGDTNTNGKLDLNEVWEYKASETVVAGEDDFVNIATVTGNVGGMPVTPDSDAAHYTSNGLVSTIGDKVWFDVDGDGVQDVGEAGASGVTVQLFRSASPSTPVETVTTDLEGNYLFRVDPGVSYFVKFVAPFGYRFTHKDRGSDLLDSDADRTTGNTGALTVPLGQQNLSVDAGLVQTAPKFFVVNDAAVTASSTTRESMFRYPVHGLDGSSTSLANGALGVGNYQPRDIAANLDASRLWVIDRNQTVYRYDGLNGGLLGSWKVSGIDTEPEGIATWGNDLWLADRSGKLYWFDDGAIRTTGASPSLTLTSKVGGSLKGITTDGRYLWAVTEGTQDQVFRFEVAYNASGNVIGLNDAGRWTLPAANSKPTGITLDPSTAGSTRIWIVDEATDTVYEYEAGRTLSSGTGVISSSFKLASSNAAPQGICDPMGTIFDEGEGWVPVASDEEAAIGSGGAEGASSPGQTDSSFWTQKWLQQAIEQADSAAAAAQNQSPVGVAAGDGVDLIPLVGILLPQEHLEHGFASL